MLQHLFKPEYHISVYSRLLQAKGAKQFFLYDEVESVLPAGQEGNVHGIVGYQRNVWLAALMSSAAPTTVLLRAPLFWEEIQFARMIRLANHARYQLQILFFHKGQLYDLFAMTEANLQRLIALYTESPTLQKYDELFERFGKEFFTKPTLVMPFQCSDYHYTFFRKYSNVLLPDIGAHYNDKNKVAKDLTAHGYGDYFVSGRSIPGADTLEAYALTVVTSIDEFIVAGNMPYLKLDSQSASGISNMSHLNYPDVFNPKISRASRINQIRNFMQERNLSGKNPGRIEDYRKVEVDVLGTKELTIRGVMIDGEYHPLGIGRMIIENSIFAGMVVSSNFSAINLNGEIGASKTLMEKLGTAWEMLGYKYGDMAIDVIPTQDMLKMQDPNFRRGGSTVSMVVATMSAKLELASGWYDREFEHSLSLSDLSTLSQKLSNAGILSYSTSMWFFPEDGKTKIKALIPFTKLLPVMQANDCDAKEASLQVISGIVQ